MNRKQTPRSCKGSLAGRNYFRMAAFAPVLLGFAVSAAAQIPLPGNGFHGAANLFNADLAVLESGEPRSDLPCDVTPDKPELGFDLRFHAGYEVTVPLKQFGGSDNLLTILFRVSEEGKQENTTYFTQRVRVPFIDEDARGEATLQGAFDLGPGKYRIDWLMRDRSEQVCSSSFDMEAALSAKEKDITPSLAPGAVERAAEEQFREEPPVRRSADEALNVKVLINFSPQNALSSAIQPAEMSALVSILRSIDREPRFAKFSLTAFNMQEQRVIYRQEDAEKIDFPALGEALQSIKLGTVGLRQLSDKHGDTEFLAGLIRKEAGNPAERPDGLIFAGPKVMLDADIQADSLKDVGPVDYPVFYMNYNRDPQATPWRDAIGRAVKFFRGYEYTITKPRDLWFAVGEVVSHIVKSRNERPAAAISTH